MLYRLLIGLLPGGLALAQPTFLSGPLVSNISHSAVRVTWVTDANPSNSEIEWGLTTSYGSTRAALRNSSAPYTSTVLISGLTPGTTYHCRARLNAGAALSADVAFTTALEPSPHPARPVPPATVDTTMPIIDGNTYSIDANCSNLQGTLSTLAGLTGSANHEMVIPVGTGCPGEWKFPARPNHSGWVVVRSSAVGTSAFPPEGVRWTKNWSTASTLATLRSRVLGLDGRGVQSSILAGPGCTSSGYVGEGGFFYNSSGPTSTIFGLLKCSDSHPAYTGATLIDSFSGSNPVTVTLPGHLLAEGMVVSIPTNGYVAAQRYFVYGVSGNTFKINTPQIGAYTGGVNLSVVNMWRNPTHTKGTGPPSGACTTEEWYYDTAAGAHEAYWCVAGAWVKFVFVTVSAQNHTALEVQGNKYRFIGIEATNQQVPGYPDSFPAGWDTPAGLLNHQGNLEGVVYVTGHDVQFDRCYLHSQPPPLRISRCIAVYGDRFALVNSYVDGCQQWYGPTGSYYQSGGSTGIAHYQGERALFHNNHLEAAGITYFAPSTSYGPADAPRDVTITRNTFRKLPGWRKTGAQPRLYHNRHAWELKQGYRYLLEGNRFDYNWSGINAAGFLGVSPRRTTLPSAYSLAGWNGATITVTGASTFFPGDVIYLTGTDAAHNGLWEVAGNGCPAACAQVTLAGNPAGSGSGGTAQLRASGRVITDVDIRHNSFYQGSELNRISGTDNDATDFKLAQTKRLRFHNNLTVDLNIRRYSDGGRVDLNGTYAANGDFGGRFLYVLGGDVEDLIVTHNTLYGSRGNTPTMLVADANVSEGLVLSDNLLTFDQSTLNAIRGGSAQGTATLNERFRRDGSPFWSAQNNVMCCGWSSYSGSYPSTFEWPTTIGAVRWLSASLTAPYDFRLRYDSPYISGGASRASDDTDVGADMDLLEAVQGRVSNPRVWGLSAASANISYLAPDAQACAVEVGTSPAWGTGTRLPDGGGDRARNVSVSGLSPQTLYHYRVLCAVEQPSGSFLTP